MKVAVIDYGAGNLRSVLNVLERLDTEASVARRPEDILAADRVILPGVGAAGEAMARIRAAGLDEALDEAVRQKARPMLGICLGMQLLAERLLEFGDHAGLGWVSGEVINIRDCNGDPGLRVPHMGWNRVEPTAAGEELFREVRSGREFYFAHSFAVRSTDESVVAARARYGGDVVAAIRKDTVFATQFHPEKSQVAGEQLIGAFLDWAP